MTVSSKGLAARWTHQAELALEKKYNKDGIRIVQQFMMDLYGRIMVDIFWVPNVSVRIPKRMLAPATFTSSIPPFLHAES